MAEFTPMMRQYLQIKEQNKDCILLYRLGDFYEMFFDDAITVSRELEITLTGRDCGQPERAPMCGIPYHAAENYIVRLIKKGYKVAICEQMEDPKLAKGLVKREITRIVTPGTVTESAMLDERRNNYIASIYKIASYIGFAFADVTTGELMCTELSGVSSFATLLDELARINPSEIVVNEALYNLPELSAIKQRFSAYISKYEEEVYNREEAIARIQKHISDFSIKEELSSAFIATGVLLKYLEEIQKSNLEHINKLQIYRTDKYMTIDLSTRRNLEITETMREKNKKGTLLWVLDKTNTAMGARMLRSWVDMPLINSGKINERLDSVETLKSDPILRADIIEKLDKIYDIERLIGRIVYGSANARDMIALKVSLNQLPELKELLSTIDNELISKLTLNLDLATDVKDLIEKAIEEEPPISVKEGGIIKSTFNEDVQKLRTASTEGKNWVLGIEAREKEATGIKTLKVGFNKVFGYYIEVSKSYVDMVPDRFIRKQTLTNGERYITEELKEIENTILGAQDKVVNLEFELFNQVRDDVAKQIRRLQQSSTAVATLDVVCALAEIADKNNYVMPEVDESDEITIRDGRHPVVEELIPIGEFVPNDTVLNQTEDRVNIITGPNMAGKSTYMRQVALIVLMAQIGSFVPASYAKIGVTDRIFTRVGASDDLSTGQSTFMVEMNEVANIVSNATKKSLLILDEIGRGTSTFDGLSIAWSVVEYIANNEKIGARTLFATHYHELTELEGKVSGVKNYCIAVKEKGEDVIFLRKIVRGGADESYGVHVAKLAGVPNIITTRANEILKGLKESNYIGKHEKELKKVSMQVAPQMDLFNYKIGEIANELDKINVNELTPIEALNVLVKLKEKL